MVYIHQNTLFVAPFDLGRLALTGAPRPVLEDIAGELGRGWHFDSSPSGTFVYLSTPRGSELSIFSIDREGHASPMLHAAPGVYTTPRFSTDGKRLAFSMSGDGRQNIWVEDMDRGTASRLAALQGVNDSEVWTRDGRYLIFRSLDQPNPGMYGVRSDGSSDAKRVLDVQNGEFPSSVSPDGK